MIHSMTAFARAQIQGSWGSAVCELKSVNHRYLEVRVHLPEELRELEHMMQDHLRQQLKRGKVECYFRIQLSGSLGTSLSVNLPLAQRLIEVGRQIAQELKEPLSLHAMEVMRWPGVVQMGETNLKDIHEELLGLLSVTLKDFLATREREGENLKKIFNQRLDELHAELHRAKERLPFILNNQRERLVGYFKEAQLDLDRQRLEQELVMFTQKIDVTEEIERIETHVGEVRRVLKQGGAIGRRLDFLMQELNREANTLGAKSVDVDTTRVSLSMKVLIEQLREQMQNIE